MTRFAELNGVRTAYDTLGEGPPIVLIHGAEAHRGSFEALAAALAASAQVVVYDQRGCGETVDPGGEHHLADLADDAAALMAHLGHARYAVMGTSLGGRIAQCLALRHPQRVERLVLCNTWPLAQTLAALNPVGVRRLKALREGLPATAPALAEMFYTPEHVAAHPALGDRFARATGNDKRSALALETMDVAPPGIGVPVLCVCGTHDAVVPQTVMRALADGLPHGSWCALAGVGHSAAVQAPLALAGVIAPFLHPAADALLQRAGD